jgi:molybdopterin converting factor subunit 1
MIVQVRLFARAKDLVGAEVVTVEVANNATVQGLRTVLAKRYPKLAGLLERSALAVNGEFANPGQMLTAKDEIALLPPVSGG